MTTKPVFVFQRRPHIEREGGFTLAGQLVVDVPKEHADKKRSRKLIMSIVFELEQARVAGRLSGDMTIGWRNGRKPDDAVDVHDDAVMAPWAARSTVIALRLGGVAGDKIPIDSDAMSQIIGTPPSPAKN